MHRLHSDNESLERIEGDPIAASDMIKVLSEKHNILSISQEAVPEHLQGHTLIVYWRERDCIGMNKIVHYPALIVILTGFLPL